VTGKEVNLSAYEKFQNPELFEQKVFHEGLKRVSQRDYEKGLSKFVNSFGFKKSTVSRRWIKATSKKLDELQNRSLCCFFKIESLASKEEASFTRGPVGLFHFAGKFKNFARIVIV
jgi:hypothetical protein